MSDERPLLHDCPGCGHRVSHIAMACPSCGHPTAAGVLHRREVRRLADICIIASYLLVVVSTLGLFTLNPAAFAGIILGFLSYRFGVALKSRVP